MLSVLGAGTCLQEAYQLPRNSAIIRTKDPVVEAGTDSMKTQGETLSPAGPA